MNKKIFLTLFTSCCAIVLFACNAKTKQVESTVQTQEVKKKVLFVVTSHDKVGDTGEKTGYYMAEVSHPWMVMHNAGYEIDFVSPKGGKAPIDAFDLEDVTNKTFWENDVYRTKVENTQPPSAIKSKDYVAMYYAGGHGTMWDFADNTELDNIARTIYENGGIIGGVCHGPSGIVNIKLSNGKYLVDGKKISAFTNEEEISLKMEKVVPFMLETTLIEHGAIFEKAGIWEAHVVADQRVVTGQNPQSATDVGEAILKEINKIR